MAPTLELFVDCPLFQGQSPADVLCKLQDECLALQSSDNMTAMILEFGNGRCVGMPWCGPEWCAGAVRCGVVRWGAV